MDNSNLQSFPPGGGVLPITRAKWTATLVLTAIKKTKKHIGYMNWKNKQIARYVSLENKPSLRATSISKYVTGPLCEKNQGQ